MKDFKDSTRTQYGDFGFGPKRVAVSAHTRTPRAAQPRQPKVAKVMGEFKAGELHSGSDQGPTVTNPKQAIAIALNQGRKAAGKAKGGPISAKSRNALPKSSFGLPGSRKYPMPDRSHAANAKARASQMEKAGKLSASSKAQIDAKANRVLNKAEGGKVTPKEAVHKHERHDHPGEPLTKLRRGGAVPTFNRAPKVGC
jgi:hypothetical protein